MGTSHGWTQVIFERLGQLPRWAGVAIGAALLAGLAGAQFLAGHEVSFSIFYLVPVLTVTWVVGRGWGLAFAVASAVTWGLVDVAAGAVYSAAWIPVWNATVRFGFFVVGVSLLDSLHRAHREARQLAFVDALTGAANSRAFYVELEREIARQRRYGERFAVAYIDLDRFKLVNDTCGHAAGDELLRGVYAEIRAALRATDTVARLGGDEFGIVMPQTRASDVGDVLERVQAAVTERLRAVGCGVEGVGATLGAVVFEAPPESADAAIRIADELMYLGKRLGRGRIQLSTFPGPRPAPEHDAALHPEARRVPDGRGTR